jgi:competence protein ComEC
MFFWRHIPLLRFLLPFIGGIICSNYVAVHIILAQVFAVISILFSLGVHLYLRKKVNINVQRVGSVVLLFLFFLIGILLTQSRQDNAYKSHFSHIKDPKFLIARVIELPQEKEKSIGCRVEVTQASDQSTCHKVQGKAQLYIAKDSASLALGYGDYIMIHGQLKDVEPIRNPHQFDFKKYYANKNIYQNGYIKSGSWHSIGHNETNPLYALGYKWQQSLLQIFDRYFKEEAVKGVAQAIVFGFKDDLDQDWLDAFSKTGTIHVLAVSGLHVGIIYTLLSWLLMLGSSRGRSRIIKSGFILVALFLYCLVTGFSPSVSRASIMFATVIIAKAFQRQSNIYNTLSFVCFLLLIIDPLNLYNVGFQFSFLAVIGIVFYKDYFGSIWPQSTKIGNHIITLLAVSLAAQITTFPIGLYYFHQYPNFFMVSNLVVIPCISVILYLGVFMVIGSFIYEPLAHFLADIATIYIQFIVRTVSYIQDIPYAFFENVHITFGQMLCIYAAIIGITIALVKKWVCGFVLTAIAIFGFVTADYLYFNELPSTEAIAFDVQNETLIGFRENDTLTLIASKGAYMDQAVSDFIIKPYLINQRITSYRLVPMETLDIRAAYGNLKSLGNGFLWYANQSYLLTDGYKGYLSNPIQVDNLVIGSKKSDAFLKYVNSYIESNKTVFLNSWKPKKATFKESKTHSSVILQNSLQQKLAFLFKNYGCIRLHAICWSGFSTT